MKPPYRVLYSNDTTNITTGVSPYHRRGETWRPEMLEATVDEVADLGVDAHLIQLAHGQVPWYQSRVTPIPEHHRWWRERFGVDPIPDAFGCDGIHQFLLDGGDVLKVFVERRLNGVHHVEHLHTPGTTKGIHGISRFYAEMCHTTYVGPIVGRAREYDNFSFRRTTPLQYTTTAHAAYARGLDGVSAFNFVYTREHGGGSRTPPADARTTGVLECRPLGRRHHQKERTMEFKDAVTARRSVRAYAPTPLDRATIEKLIRTATQAPSAMNTQPWAFGVIEGVDALKGYGDRAKAALLAVLDQMPVLERYRDMLADPNFNLFYGAPALVVIYGKPASPIPETDCALAAENLMLAAADMGLGTCWIGFAQGFFDSPEVKKELGVPENYKAVAPLVVGHPAGPVPPVPRNDPEVVYWK